jgi:hypothetical protein
MLDLGLNQSRIETMSIVTELSEVKKQIAQLDQFAEELRGYL